MENDEVKRNRAVGTLVGLAIGDALGTTLEFKPPGTFKPLTDMVGGGQFFLKKGQWTDDTSMALCLGYSLLECNGFNAHDQMDRYCRWMDEGYQSSIGICFDIGIGVSSALKRFKKTGEPYSGSKARWSSGNGSLMRMAPVPIFFHIDPQLAEKYGALSSRTTHGSELCIDASRYFSTLLCELINGADKSITHDTDYRPETPEVEALKAGRYLTKPYQALTGSGYVIESLESALWCFANTHSYEACVLDAANLGNDADTTAAIAGQLAGAYYGYTAIRQDWCDAIHRHDDLVQLASELYQQGCNYQLEDIDG